MPFHETDDSPYYEPQRRRRQPARLSPGLVALIALAGIGLGVASYYVGSKLLTPASPVLTNPEAKPREAVANGPLDPQENENHTVFENVKDCVVSVNLVLQKRTGWDLSEETTGAGSGFVWDTDGRVVTNFHVVQEAIRRQNIAVRVVMSDPGIKYNASIVGVAPEYDLAVIQLRNPDKVKPIEVGKSSDLKVGQKAFAIGNPFELPGTMSMGIISALDRPTRAPSGGVISGCIQHTAAINPGNSGGPLLNRFGRLIGVNSSIITPSGGNVGIGFAIPVDTVNSVVTEIIRTGRTPQPDLGIALYDQLKLRQAGYDRGVMIASVKADGPAATAGLRGIRREGRVKPGDLIVSMNGTPIDSIDEYQHALARLKPGDKVVITYIRDDNELQTTVTVGGV